MNKIYWMAIKNYVDNILPIIEPLLTSWQLPPRECVSTGAAGALTYSSLGHHFLHPLILRLLVLCAPAVLRPRALQDAPAPADPNS